MSVHFTEGGSRWQADVEGSPLGRGVLSTFNKSVRVTHTFSASSVPAALGSSPGEPGALCGSRTHTALWLLLF